MPASNQNSLSRFLERLLRHSKLNQQEQEAILGLGSEASQVRANQEIVVAGEKVEHACMIVSGLAGRFDEMRDGRRQITTFHIPGDMCDLHSVIVPRPSWSIAACSTTTVLHVPHRELRAIAERYPAIAIAFWRDTVLDASILAKWVGNLGRKDAQARLAHLLCEMGVRMELAELGTRTSYRFDITQEQLADAVGITPVHLNRTLQALRGMEAIAFQSRMVEIPDWDRLVEIAEFDPDFLLASGQQEPRVGVLRSANGDEPAAMLAR